MQQALARCLYLDSDDSSNHLPVHQFSGMVFGHAGGDLRHHPVRQIGVVTIASGLAASMGAFSWRPAQGKRCPAHSGFMIQPAPRCTSQRQASDIETKPRIRA